MKPHAKAGAAQERKNAAGPGEKLAIEHGVDPALPQGSYGAEAVHHEVSQGVVTNGDDVLLRNHVEYVQDFLVLLKQQHEDRRGWIFLLDAVEHRLGQHEASHLG